MKNITLEKKTSYTQAAAVKRLFNRPVIYILKFLTFLGFFAFLILLYALFNGDLNSFIFVVLRVLAFLGAIAFFNLKFVNGYLKDHLNKVSLSNHQANYNIYEIATIELINILAHVAPDLKKIFQAILATHRVNFIIAELNISTEKLAGIVESLTGDQEAYTKIIAVATDNAYVEGNQKVSPADIFYGYLKVSPKFSATLLNLEITETDLKNVLFWQQKVYQKIENQPSLTDRLKTSGAGIAQNWTSGYTLNLDRYSRDISEDGSFSVEGKNEILDQVESILTKNQKNDCILTGETGVGKTTLVYGLAARIKSGQSLPELAYKRVVSLDTGALLSGTQKTSELTARLMSILNDAVRAGNIILFIDEIENLFSGEGRTGTIDATAILEPYLENSKIRVIGTTSERDFQTYISSRQSLAGNFTEIKVPVPGEEETIRILEEMSLYYSNKYNLKIAYPALKEIYLNADKFISGKAFPAKAIDLLDETCSLAKNQDLKQIDKGTVDALSQQTLKIPVGVNTEEDKTKLLNLESLLHQRVIGQDEAVDALANALRRARTQVTSGSRPVGSFLFLGPTGVGKTELAKALAGAYFGDEQKIIRMDMNEFQEASSIDRFIGKKVTGTADLEGGEFIKQAKESPFSVVLLDELEKADKSILDLFLQALDEGYLMDGEGNKVILTNMIIIATSNAGANLIRESVQKGLSSTEIQKTLMNYLQEEGIYKPEFLNRFDGIIYFKPLSTDDLMSIAKLIFAGIKADFEGKGYQVDISPAALEMIIKVGYQPELGARPMRRAFQDYIGNFLANGILAGSLKKGVPFTIELADIQKPVKP